MGCTGCESKSGLPKGCKSNGSCATDGCDKLSVFDWLVNMNQPVEQLRFPFVEVRFKNDRKEYYNNTDNIQLGIGDVVAVQTNSGHDIGVVSLTGELVRTQMKKRGVRVSEELPKIYRKANQKDIDIWQGCRQKEEQMMIDARRIAREIGLGMKISNVEYQGDGNKATFYYTSESRVDFRQLIRDFASAFKCRIEMKQIGYRQEAAKLGGIGSCGRELCCSTWLTDFRSVSTAAARFQQLSINPQKIAGQCGKLKCCLNYELDAYKDSLRHFPKNDVVIETANGKANIVKIDVFKKEVWLAYQKSDVFTWFKFDLEKVNGFIKQNTKGQKTKTLEELNQEYNQPESLFSKDIIEENSLQRFEKEDKKKRRRKKPRPKNKQGAKPTNKTEGNRSNRNQNQVNKNSEAKRKNRKKRYNKPKSNNKGEKG